MPADQSYFDLQVNGYAGVDFNQDDLAPDALHRACQRLEADGVGGILATIITEDVDRMCRRLSTLARLREADPLARRLIAGLHVEGPFLNETPGFRGAHPADAIRPANERTMGRLLDGGGGLVRLVTLAPERDDGCRVTRMLASQGVLVAAGHTDASLDQLRVAADAGLRLFTHLGNGCPMQLGRHDNIIQRALHLQSLDPRLWIAFIADGVHVPFFALGNYLRSADRDRCVIVTDAIAAAGLGPGRYTLGRWTLDIGDDLVARAPDGSHLVGSAVTMERGTRNVAAECGLTSDEARRLSGENPRRFLGIL
jgi:N-acetylglucosamine-6-phosphate deacetylase